MKAKFGWLGWILAGGAVVAAAVGLGWWAGKAHREAAVPGMPGDPPGFAETGQAEVGRADPFAALSCQPRQYHDAMALAVTFTQPVDRRADLGAFLQVVDTGPASGDEDPAQAGRPVSVRPAGEAHAGKPVQGSWVVGDNPRVVYFPYVRPQRAYDIAIRAGLPGAGGAQQQDGVRCAATTQAMAPAFHFASRGVVLPAGQNGGLPVVTVNVPEVDVQFLRIEPARVPEFFGTVLGIRGGQAAAAEDAQEPDDGWRYADNRSLQGRVGNWDLDRLHGLTRSVYQGRFLTSDKSDSRQVTFLPVEDIEPLREPGIYVAVMSEPGRFRYDYQVTYFYVSDIGVHARRYPDAIDAYAVSLKGGKAMPGVVFELVDDAGKALARATADEQGRARFEGDHRRARVVRAQRGQEMTVLALGEPALDLSEFEVGGHPVRRNSLFVYAGRDLYRPGETFSVSVLPRDPDGRALAPVPLTATLKRPDGRVVRTALWQPDSGVPGYVGHAIEVPPDAQTGAWMLELRVDPAARTPDASWRFQVEEFMPERMKLALSSPQQVLAPDETWSVRVQGDYLYGTPASGNRLVSSYQVRRHRHALAAQWPGFLFGDVADDARRHFEELPETKLDADGSAELSLDPQAQGVQSPMQVRLSASLLESGGRPVVRSIERAVWPAPVLIGLRPLFAQDVAREGAPAAFEVIRVDAQGRVVPVRGANLRVYREDRRYYWRYDDQRGWNSGYVDDEELVEARVIDAGERAALSVPVRWGTYRLEIADPETGLSARYRFYAGWSAQAAEAMGNRPDRVQMRVEGLPARPGGSVTLTMTPPHDGQALVTVEGDELLWSRWMPVRADGTTLEIPLDPSWKRHDLYVSATVFRPGSEGDRVTPARALGLAYIPLDSESRRPRVELSAPQKIRPEQRVDVGVKVAGAAGKRAHVTISAVDAGILNISQYATPDPMAYFFGQQRYAAELLDMYGKLIEKMDGMRGRLKWGGDAALRGDSRSLPRKVRLVDLFSGPVALDERGEAVVGLDLPDFNGTLRLMAVAFSDDDYGSADREMVVAAPVVAELGMPRFITPGDRAALALDLVNLSGAPQTLAVRLDAQAPLTVDDAERTVTLADGERTTLRFVAGAAGSYGLARIDLSVAGRDGAEPLRIARTEYLQVQPAHAPERHVRRMRLEPGESLALQPEWTQGYHPDSVLAGLTVSNRPPLDAARLVRDLLNYPYGCTEQTISAAYPWLLVDDETARRLGLPAHTQAEREAKVAAALSRLAGMGSAAGAFSLWGAGQRDLWLTGYVAEFMQAARDRGHAISAPQFERTTRWLLEQVQQAGGGFGAWPARLSKNLETGRYERGDLDILRNDHRRFAGLAAAALVLARDGAVPLASVRLLFDNYQERARSPLPLVQLAAAFKRLGDEGRAQAALDLAMSRAYGMPRDEGFRGHVWLGDYGSAVRDYAMAYALAVSEDLRHERRELLLQEAVGGLAGRSYLSTQEQVALLRADQAAGAGAGTPWQAQWQAGGASRALAGEGSQSLSLGAEAFGAGRLLNTGDNPLFVELDIQGSPVQAPEPRMDVIPIVRNWYYPDGRAWNGEPLTTGDMIVARLQVNAVTPIPEGLVVDRVPAGFEVENLNLSQGGDMRDWRIGGRYVAEAMADSNVTHREFRDDRFVAAVRLGGGKIDIFYMLRVVTPGRYEVPSAVAEDMYRPELRGVSRKWEAVEVVDRQPASP